ncbi:unnamed protein product [Angiostrongylus costaricensis]|uniref:Kinesin motor domain-containing protein n=1 Tax=Angiostrongylus costaricensis TaxID=334426 RepID=A0A158PEL7_ANGCS|nr:unnamed protein product [Angiostrongylus costaricensis]
MSDVEIIRVIARVRPASTTQERIATVLDEWTICDSDQRLFFSGRHSIVVLGRLMRKLSGVNRRDEHISHRDSELTHILEDSLGGNSRTSVFANVHIGRKSHGIIITIMRGRGSSPRLVGKLRTVYMLTRAWQMLAVARHIKSKRAYMLKNMSQTYDISVTGHWTIPFFIMQLGFLFLKIVSEKEATLKDICDKQQGRPKQWIEEKSKYLIRKCHLEQSVENLNSEKLDLEDKFQGKQNENERLSAELRSKVELILKPEDLLNVFSSSASSRKRQSSIFLIT